METLQLSAKNQLSFQSSSRLNTISISEIRHSHEPYAPRGFREESEVAAQLHLRARRVSSKEFDSQVDQLAKFCGVQNHPEVLTLSQTYEALEDNLRRNSLKYGSEQTEELLRSGPGVRVPQIVQSVLVPDEPESLSHTTRNAQRNALRAKARGDHENVFAEVKSENEKLNVQRRQVQTDNCSWNVFCESTPLVEEKDNHRLVNVSPLRSKPVPSIVSERAASKENVFPAKGPAKLSQLDSDIRISREDSEVVESAWKSQPRSRMSISLPLKTDNPRNASGAKSPDTAASGIFSQVTKSSSTQFEIAARNTLPSLVLKNAQPAFHVTPRDGSSSLLQKAGKKTSVGGSFSIVRYPSQEEKVAAVEEREAEIQITKTQLKGWMDKRDHRREPRPEWAAANDSGYTFYDYEEQFGRLQQRGKEMKDALEMLDADQKLRVKANKKLSVLKHLDSPPASTEEVWWKKLIKRFTCSTR